MEEKKIYYVGSYQAYRSEIRSRGLDPALHIFMARFEKFLGLPRDIEIQSVGPVEASREIVRALRERGYTETYR